MKTKRCPECSDPGNLVEGWEPEKGLDNRLRQFKCRWGHVFYARLTLPEMKQIGAIREHVKE